jgi:ABC-type glutathione transport system ATPase component
MSRSIAKSVPHPAFEMLAVTLPIRCDGIPVQALLEVADYSLSDGGRFSVTLPELRLLPGQTAALYGPSGCGKTSMLMSIFGLLEREGWRGQGEVQFCGRSLHGLAGSDLLKLRRQEVAFLMQDAHNALDPLVRVGEQVFAATGAAPDQIHAMLGRLGVDDAAQLCQRQPHRISGGQAQRVLLAIAFLREPTVVIADEPSASLDGGSYAELLARLRELVESGSALLRSIAVQPEVLLLDEPTASLDRAAAVAVIDNLLTMQRNRAVAIVVATHDESLAAAIAHRQLTVREGQLCE